MPCKLCFEHFVARFYLPGRRGQREDLFLDNVDRHDFIKHRGPPPSTN